MNYSEMSARDKSRQIAEISVLLRRFATEKR